jgi:uncharacterized pyridoxal phosphate-containing UPF0001 family protein
MGMASNTSDTARVRKEFAHLKKLADVLSFTDSPIISMGMSNDYALAVEEGSTLVRIGSLLFGARN